MFTFQTNFNRVKAQHPVDRKMPPEITQEFDVVQFIKPVGVIDHDRIGRAIAKCQELLKHFFDASHVGGNDFVGQNRAGVVTAGWITNTRGTAAHQNNRLVAGFL